MPSKRAIAKKLHLSAPFKISTARDCFATTLLRANKPIEAISEALGHSSILVTQRYCAGMNSKASFELNEALF